MIRLAVLVLALAAVPACRSPIIDDPSPGIVRGQIEGGKRLDRSARVQVYGIDSEGLVTREPFETVLPDALGRFATRVLSPGRYRIVYRGAESPPSVTTVRVPVDTQAVLRPVAETGLVQLRAASAGVDLLLCRLTEVKPVEGVVDVREFRCSSGAPAVLRGLRPGRWRVDVPELAATTEIELPVGSPEREVTIDPPPVAAGASLTGEVRRLDGAGGAWLVVTARPLADLHGPAGRWGRYAVTDLEGRYRIVGIPPGQALVRVECREVPVRILPSALSVTIPPSGTVEMGFVVEP